MNLRSEEIRECNKDTGNCCWYLRISEYTSLHAIDKDVSSGLLFCCDPQLDAQTDTHIDFDEHLLMYSKEQDSGNKL